jgi:hypothetical protein
MAAGTTNAQQWNPTAANQETDAAYTADSQRAGGAANTSIFMSPTANKLFYQLSTYNTALFQAFANKGFTTSDSNLNTLTAQCANFLTSADMRAGLSQVAYAASVALNAAASNGFFIPLGGNLTISAVNGAVAGQMILMVYQQNGNGGATVQFPANFVDAVQPDPTPNVVSVQIFAVDTVTGYFRSNGGFFTSATFSGNIKVSGNANLGSLQIGGGAQNGYVLTGNGTTFVPMAPVAATVTRGPLQSNATGYWYQWSDGTIEQWGVSAVIGNGAAVHGTGNFMQSFATPFTTPASVNIQVGLTNIATTGTDSGCGAWAVRNSLTNGAVQITYELDNSTGTAVWWRAIGK